MSWKFNPAPPHLMAIAQHITNPWNSLQIQSHQQNQNEPNELSSAEGTAKKALIAKLQLLLQDEPRAD
ncbi:hypothetical protein lerEdw1_018620 [Lerista edwardsae]|nr:hypothetical protein lerEdw1_018620 [Lerista edwardsae]